MFGRIVITVIIYCMTLYYVFHWTLNVVKSVTVIQLNEYADELLEICPQVFFVYCIFNKFASVTSTMVSGHIICNYQNSLIYV